MRQNTAKIARISLVLFEPKSDNNFLVCKFFCNKIQSQEKCNCFRVKIFFLKIIVNEAIRKGGL